MRVDRWGTNRDEHNRERTVVDKAHEKRVWLLKWGEREVASRHNNETDQKEVAREKTNRERRQTTA